MRANASTMVDKTTASNIYNPFSELATLIISEIMGDNPLNLYACLLSSTICSIEFTAARVLSSAVEPSRLIAIKVYSSL